MTKYVKLKCFKCGFVTYLESDWRKNSANYAYPADHCSECGEGTCEEIGSATKYEHDKHHYPPDPIIWSELFKEGFVGIWDMIWGIAQFIMVIAFWVLVIALIGITFEMIDNDGQWLP
jgi:hypothetical protein